MSNSAYFEIVTEDLGTFPRMVTVLLAFSLATFILWTVTIVVAFVLNGFN